jgi:hypothetical protein
MPKSIALAATAGTLLWFATMPWFDHLPILVRAVIVVAVVVVTVGGAALVRPGRREQP